MFPADPVAEPGRHGNRAALLQTVSTGFSSVCLPVCLHIRSSSGPHRSLIFYTTRRWLIHIIFIYLFIYFCCCCIWHKKGEGTKWYTHTHTHTLDRLGTHNFIYTCTHVFIASMHRSVPGTQRVFFLLFWLFHNMTDVHHHTTQSSFPEWLSLCPSALVIRGRSPSLRTR